MLVYGREDPFVLHVTSCSQMRPAGYGLATIS